MTPLARLLVERIRCDGPITVAGYMAECLGHPEHGYYMARDPFGSAGDFITAPEISQMFGELLGLWAAAHWQALGAPAPVRLVELGPGRGTLMADALRAARGVPGFTDAVHVDLVETSARLQDRQKDALANAVPADRLSWHDTLDTVPPGPALVLANEFFDALPVRQFERTQTGWRERLVGPGPEPGSPLSFVLGEDMSEPPVPIPDTGPLAPGSVVETSPAGLAVAAVLGARLAAGGGAALIVDYGHARSGAGETLQAVRDHAYAGVFDTPGEADLTAHVDFQALAGAAQAAGARAFGPLDQAELLHRLGIRERATALRARAALGQADDVRTALDRLTGADAMGRLFKALALAPADGPVPPGFGG